MKSALRRSLIVEGFGSKSADETVRTAPTESTSRPKLPPALSMTSMSCGPSRSGMSSNRRRLTVVRTSPR